MKKRILNLILIIISSLSVLLLAFYILDLINFKCIFKELFNIYCAGCGTTRMIKALLDFEIYQAFRYNPFMFLLTFITFIFLIYNMIFYLVKGKLKKISFKVIIFIVVLLFIYMLLRNVSGLEFLRPTKVL